MDLWLKILIAVAAFALFTGLVLTLIIAFLIFKNIFVRKAPEMYTRDNSEPGASADHDAMHELAVKWHSEHLSFVREISIQNDGLKLAGQYLDFGFDRCVIITAGRTEACIYGTVFAEPYVNSGYNILVPDSRAHGFSEGKYVTMGYREHGDLLAWIRYAHESLGCRQVALHGVCVGAATSVYAATAENAPDYISSITVEGLFDNFYDVLRQRIKARGRKPFPVLQELWLICWAKYGVNYRRFTPLSRIGTLKVPILFIHSREDVSSLPAAGERLFAACSSPVKKMVWMESGSHSHIRLVHREEYDNAIRSFLGELDHSSDIR